MIIGFLGKGGSGKSSLATQVALFLHQQNYTVCAVDADHNMDLSFNLSAGEVPDMPYLGASQERLLHAVGLKWGDTYAAAFKNEPKTRFRLTPPTEEISDSSVLLENGMRLFAAGPQTDDVLYGKSCSHSIAAPLKILLPLLELQQNEIVVVDEKAGADGVSTGIVTGIDVGVIVCEPALHSIKTAKQIAELMNFYNTSYVFIGNKITSSEDELFLTKELGERPLTFLSHSTAVTRNPFAAASEWRESLQLLLVAVEVKNRNDRLNRTMEKYSRNKSYAT